MSHSIRDDLKNVSKEGIYLNFMVGSEKWNRTRDAFSPEVFEKLVELKKRYDPENMFCFNQNITPELD
jgi:FAD/FMN-containing dehydrogenase